MWRTADGRAADETAKAVADKVVLRNPAGHMHFASNWYGGRKVTREGDGGGLTRPLQSAAWRFTGDARYFGPIE